MSVYIRFAFIVHNVNIKKKNKNVIFNVIKVIFVFLVLPKIYGITLFFAIQTLFFEIKRLFFEIKRMKYEIQRLKLEVQRIKLENQRIQNWKFKE